MSAWSLDRARTTYSIPYWSDGYFDVDAKGRMCVLPRGAGGPVLAIPEVLDQATAAGL
jgi:arginine decarboxylase